MALSSNEKKKREREVLGQRSVELVFLSLEDIYLFFMLQKQSNTTLAWLWLEMKLVSSMTGLW
jgi:hypothetical protein